MRRFWKNKKVFITGHTGFKGGWLSLWMQMMGADVFGYSFAPLTKPNFFEAAQVQKGMRSIIGDIVDLQNLKKPLKKFQPDIIFHLAAQPIVHTSYKNPIETFSVNVMGTANILEAARSINSVKSIVSVTTDKCYANKEWVWPYRENDPLGSDNPYAASKSCAELIIESYRTSFKLPVASARAGNVIGGGDWGEYRLVPDIVNAIYSQKPLKLRNSNSIRPWQFVLDSLLGYITLAQKLYESPAKFQEAWNFGPDSEVVSVGKVVKLMFSLAKKPQNWSEDKDQYSKESKYLKLDSSKSRALLGWNPKLNLKEGLELTMRWYQAHKELENMRRLTESQIKYYQSI